MAAKLIEKECGVKKESIILLFNMQKIYNKVKEFSWASRRWLARLP
ncbi:MAG: hypothetical protein J7L26_10655 [Candidatus Aminicenantes bacterium]|nr:hypothetical protein [Candidatus Aminicenantes bacterium]